MAPGEKLAGYIEGALASPEVEESRMDYCCYNMNDKICCCAKGLAYIGEAVERGLTPREAYLAYIKERQTKSKNEFFVSFTKKIGITPEKFGAIENLHLHEKMPAKKIAQKLRSGEIKV